LVTDRDLDISLIPPGGPGARLVIHSIGGTVRQGTNPFAGATVQVTNITLTRKQTTDAEGHFRFKNLPPGLFELRAEAPGLAAQPKMIKVPRELVGDPDYDLVLN
jgi:hypothetical protein